MGDQLGVKSQDGSVGFCPDRAIVDRREGKALWVIYRRDAHGTRARRHRAGVIRASDILICTAYLTVEPNAAFWPEDPTRH